MLCGAATPRPATTHTHEQIARLVAVQQQVEDGQAFRLSLSEVEGLCVSVLRLTAWAAELADRVRADCGWELTHAGQPYLGAGAISASHLLLFMEGLRQATEATGMRR